MCVYICSCFQLSEIVPRIVCNFPTTFLPLFYKLSTIVLQASSTCLQLLQFPYLLYISRRFSCRFFYDFPIVYSSTVFPQRYCCFPTMFLPCPHHFPMVSHLLPTASPRGREHRALVVVSCVALLRSRPVALRYIAVVLVVRRMGGHSKYQYQSTSLTRQNSCIFGGDGFSSYSYIRV